MLAKIASEYPDTWDTLLPAVLFAYREVPQDTSGFSPFQLVYGSNPRGPLQIYKELLSGKVTDDANITNYELVTSIRDRVMKACIEAHDAIDTAKTKYKVYANQNAKKRQITVGQEVLLLLPDDKDKLSICWKGPFKVTKQISKVDYQIDIKGKKKIFHINMFKEYHQNDEKPEQEPQYQTLVANSVVNEDAENAENIQVIEPVTKSSSTYKDCFVDKSISSNEKEQLAQLMEKYAEIFSDIPGKSKFIQHHIKLTTDNPIKIKPYPVPIHYQDKVNKEIEELEKLGIIQRSESNYSSPMVIIRKKIESIMICIDYRKLIAITITDAEPIPNVDELIVLMGKSNIFSKLDMTMGYYQEPMTKESKHFTAFSTNKGLYEFNYMPFGLVNASATFIRMTRSLLRGVKNVSTYMDDMCVHTSSFDEHLQTLEKVFDRLKNAGLTVKPSKIELALKKITFLGHTIQHGFISNDDKIVTKILTLGIQDQKTCSKFAGINKLLRKICAKFR